MKAKTKLLHALVCGVLLLGTTGCRSPFRQKNLSPRASDAVFDYDGIPLREYYVGGGYVIRYIAKENGALFMADDTAGRLLETISLHAGEEYETKYEIKDLDTVIKLYFVPETRF